MILTQHPASARSDRTSGIERVRQDPSSGRAEIKNPNVNEDIERVRRNPLRDLPEWLEEFTENLVDDSVPEHRDASSSSHDLPAESREEKRYRINAVSILTSRKAEIVTSAWTEITWAPCRKRTGTVVHRAEHFGDLITADQQNSQ